MVERRDTQQVSLTNGQAELVMYSSGWELGEFSRWASPWWARIFYHLFVCVQTLAIRQHPNRQEEIFGLAVVQQPRAQPVQVAEVAQDIPADERGVLVPVHIDPRRKQSRRNLHEVVHARFLRQTRLNLLQHNRRL